MPSWPRFAAPGDRFNVPVVLFNNTASGGTATISAELQADTGAPKGLLTFGEHAEDHLVSAGMFLPAHGQTQIDLPVTVGQAAGVAHGGTWPVLQWSPDGTPNDEDPV